ncbi:MAG: zinc ribbon domain-containing protein [Acidimicrobiales bacterium]
MTWHRVQALTAANTRTNAVTPSRRKTHVGVRRAEPSRYPLAGLVICDCCGKKLQGSMVRGNALYRCSRSNDYAAPLNNHPPSLSVREDRLLSHVDGWLSEIYAPERIAATAREVVEADASANREDPAITRARATMIECERKLAKHLDGLEAGIPADIIASRIAAAQREKAAAEAVLALAPPAPKPLTFDEVVEALTMLRNLPELLEVIEQADRAGLYQALGLTVRYRRVGTSEQVKLTSTLVGVELERVGEPTCNFTPRGPNPRGVELERVGGGT